MALTDGNRWKQMEGLNEEKKKNSPHTNLNEFHNWPPANWRLSDQNQWHLLAPVGWKLPRTCWCCTHTHDVTVQKSAWKHKAGGWTLSCVYMHVILQPHLTQQPEETVGLIWQCSCWRKSLPLIPLMLVSLCVIFLNQREKKGQNVAFSHYRVLLPYKGLIVPQVSSYFIPLHWKYNVSMVILLTVCIWEVSAVCHFLAAGFVAFYITCWNIMYRLHMHQALLHTLSWHAEQNHLKVYPFLVT